MRTEKQVAQAFIELRAEDPEATSALRVACARLPAADGLAKLRRLRVFELSGALPPGASLTELLHRSTQFYNPANERCAVRAVESDPTGLNPDEHAIVVYERGGARRTAAERWWRHETGVRIEVREGTAWALTFAPDVDATERTRLLVLTEDRQHGLLCNPHFQEWRAAPTPGTAPPT